MQNKIIESVLTELVEEQQSTMRAMLELNNHMKDLTTGVKSMQTNSNFEKTPLNPSDTKKVEQILADGILQLQQVITTQPKSVTRNYRLLLFPEMYADNYYRIVFGRLLFWMMIFLLASYLFVLGKNGINSWERIQIHEAGEHPYEKAWQYLYRHESKLRIKMDSAWLKASDVKN